MSTYSALKLEEITLGDSGWGTSTTNNLLAIQQALQSATLATGDFTANVATLPWTNTSATTNTPRAMALNITATLTGAGTVNMPAISGGKAYLVINATGYAVTVKVTGLTGVTVPSGKSMWLWNNGTDIVDGTNYISSLSLGSALPIASGGTGAATAATARTSLGATTLGGNLFTISDPGAVTFPRFNADNTVSALNAADFRTAIGAGSGTGTVTGVTATAPVASSGGTAPVISLNANYGDTANPYASKTANYFLAAPNGSAGAPAFRAIVAADIPTLNQNTTGTAAGLSSTLAIASGGTGQTTQQAAMNALAGSTTSAQFLRGDGTNVTMSAIQAGDIPTLNQNTTGYAAGLAGGAANRIAYQTGSNATGFVAAPSLANSFLTWDGSAFGWSTTTYGTIPVASGGTGKTSWTNNTLPYNNGTTSFASSGYYFDGTNGGLAYAPESWSGTWNVFRMGRTMYLAQDGGTTLGNGYVVNGAYFDGTNWIRQYASISPTAYRAGSGSHVFSYAATGAAGSTFSSFTDVATISSAGITLSTGNFVGNLTGTASTASALTTGNSYQVGSLGVGTAASGTTGEIRATNNITAYYSSDIRFKENVHEITGATQIACNIGGKYFDWNDEYIAEHGGEDGYFIRKQDFGVVAQDVLEHFPRAVRKRPDGYLAVDYEKLCALAFAAIKELEARLSRLEVKG